MNFPMDELRLEQLNDLRKQRTETLSEMLERIEAAERELDRGDPLRKSVPKTHEEYRQVFLSLNPVCWYCRKPSEALHHFDGNHENDRPGNHVAACARCHAIVHRKGLHWHPRLNRRMTATEVERFRAFATRHSGFTLNRKRKPQHSTLTAPSSVPRRNAAGAVVLASTRELEWRAALTDAPGLYLKSRG